VLVFYSLPELPVKTIPSSSGNTDLPQDTLKQRDSVGSGGQLRCGGRKFSLRPETRLQSPGPASIGGSYLWLR